MKFIEFIEFLVKAKAYITRSGIKAVSSSIFLGSASVLVANWIERKLRRRRMKLGTKPLTGTGTFEEIERPTVTSCVENLILAKSTDKNFGVILGPTGTGKTHLTQKICNKFAPGIIYSHVTIPSLLPETLSEAAQMRTKPIFIDSIIKFFFPNFVSNLSLPTNFSEGISSVLNEINHTAKYIQKYCKLNPTLVLDGVDVIAKKDKNMFLDLITECKRITDQGFLKIVLVSSEGHIIPLLEGSSSNNRLYNILEVTDLSAKEAITYLKKFSCDEKENIDVYKFTGGRISLLRQYIYMKEFLKSSVPICGKEEMHELLKKRIENRIVGMSLQTLVTVDPVIREKILHPLKTHDEVSVDDLTTMFQTQNDFDVLQKLINVHVLRYTSERNVTWHNDIIKNYVKNSSRF